MRSCLEIRDGNCDERVRLIRGRPGSNKVERVSMRHVDLHVRSVMHTVCTLHNIVTRSKLERDKRGCERIQCVARERGA